MHSGPLNHKAQHFGWKLATQYAKGVDLYGCLIIILASMEMRWIVIVEVHRDHDAQKPANLRHEPSR